MDSEINLEKSWYMDVKHSKIWILSLFIASKSDTIKLSNVIEFYFSGNLNFLIVLDGANSGRRLKECAWNNIANGINSGLIKV